MTNPVLDLKKARICSHLGCIRYGRWMPKIVVSMVDQLAVEKSPSLLITILLCDGHKALFEPASVLTPIGKTHFIAAIKKSRGKSRKINWDTLRVEWADIDDVSKVIH